mmetsp:Transcript_3625/g.3737  ORF Transcript_3625/g.3737 Transcript_3625/m.3737 type:complete len:403 (+) Transcript_3625:159-1367(+)
MGGGISSKISTSFYKKNPPESNGVRTCVKGIEVFVSLVLEQSNDENKLIFIAKNTTACSTFVQYLMLNYYDQCQSASTDSPPTELSGVSPTKYLLASLQKELRSLFTESNRSSERNYLLEGLAAEALPSYMKSEFYKMWRDEEVKQRKSWLKSSEKRLAQTTLPDIELVSAQKNNIEEAHASIYHSFNDTTVLNIESTNPIIPQNRNIKSNIKHVNEAISLEANPIDWYEQAIIQQAINSCDEQDTMEFIRQGSWLSEFIIAVEKLPIAITLFRASTSNVQFPSVYINQSYEHMMHINRDNVIGTDVLSKCFTSNEYSIISILLARVENFLTPTVEVIDCTPYRATQPIKYVFGLKPVLDIDGSCSYIICIQRPASHRVVMECRVLYSILTSIPDYMVSNEK